MHMPEIQSVLNEKNISFSYVEEDNCGSIDFEHRGLRYHIWEFADDVEPVGVETNLRYAGRDEELRYDSRRTFKERILSDFISFLGKDVYFMTPVLQPQLEKVTLEQYEMLPEEKRFEVFDGVVYDMASPSQVHQALSMQLSTLINTYILRKKSYIF